MTEDLVINEVTTDFITASHLTEVKRQYFELDLINEISGKRYVFMIPKDIFRITLMNRTIVKPKVAKMSDRNNDNKTHPQMTI